MGQGGRARGLCPAEEGRLGKRPFRWRDLPHYLLMELWMIWNMVPYLWYRLVVVRFDLK